jgi:hypothetical protein
MGARFPLYRIGYWQSIMPTERTPLTPLLATFIPEWGTPYRVKDGDTWESVARAHFLDVMSLMEFQFPHD